MVKKAPKPRKKKYEYSYKKKGSDRIHSDYFMARDPKEAALAATNKHKFNESGDVIFHGRSAQLARVGERKWEDLTPSFFRTKGSGPKFFTL